MAQLNDFLFIFDKPTQALVVDEKVLVTIKGLGVKSVNSIVNLGNLGQMIALFWLNILFWSLFILIPFANSYNTPQYKLKKKQI